MFEYAAGISMAGSLVFALYTEQPEKKAAAIVISMIFFI
jgi:hypothetical protein